MTEDPHISTELPSEPTSIPAARRLLAPFEADLEPVTFLNLRLLVSELVTNAIRHVPAEQAGTIRLEILRTDAYVRVVVEDQGDGFQPGPSPDDPARASGWGLNILAKVASRWGVENDGGARVWFEIDEPWTARRAGAQPDRTVRDAIA